MPNDPIERWEWEGGRPESAPRPPQDEPTVQAGAEAEHDDDESSKPSGSGD